MIEHRDPDDWRLDGLHRPYTIRAICCTRCGARYDATPQNRLAAIDENYAGIYLRRLEEQGRAAL